MNHKKEYIKDENNNLNSRVNKTSYEEKYVPSKKGGNDAKTYNILHESKDITKKTNFDNNISKPISNNKGSKKDVITENILYESNNTEVSITKINTKNSSSKVKDEKPEFSTLYSKPLSKIKISKKEVITDNILYESNEVLESNTSMKRLISENKDVKQDFSSKPKSKISKKDVITDNILYESNKC